MGTKDGSTEVGELLFVYHGMLLSFHYEGKVDESFNEPTERRPGKVRRIGIVAARKSSE